jgi:hypothetical protein
MGGFLLEKIMAASGNGTYDYSTPASGGDIKGYNPDYSSIFGTQNANSQNFNTAQNNQVGNFTGAYNAAAQAMPSYQSLLNNANSQYNVQPLAENAANLTNQVLRLPSENYGMTQGSDTNQAQLDQMTGVQQFRLQPLATAATNNAQVAQGLANNMVNYGVQNETQMLSPYANTVPLQQALTTGAYTNFTSQQSDQLAALNAKLAQGVQLTTTEMNNLNALQVAKTNADALVAAQQAANQYKLVSPSQGIWNAQTGTASTPYNSTAKQIPGTANTA